MIDLRISHPAKPNLALRLLAYPPMSEPDKFLAKIHVLENGSPLAEDPIAESWETEATIASWIADSVRDGYQFRPFNRVYRDAKRQASARSVERKREKGISVRCKRMAVPGRLKCETHLEDDRMRNRKAA